MMLIPDYHLQFTFGYQIGFRSSGFQNIQKYRVVLGFLEQARVAFRVENHDPVPTVERTWQRFCRERGESEDVAEAAEHHLQTAP